MSPRFYIVDLKNEIDEFKYRVRRYLKRTLSDTIVDDCVNDSVLIITINSVAGPDNTNCATSDILLEESLLLEVFDGFYKVIKPLLRSSINTDYVRTDLYDIYLEFHDALEQQFHMDFEGVRYGRYIEFAYRLGRVMPGGSYELHRFDNARERIENLEILENFRHI